MQQASIFITCLTFISEVLNTTQLLSSTFVEADSENKVQGLYKGVIVGGEPNIRTFRCDVWKIQTDQTSLYQGPEVLGYSTVVKQVGHSFVQS